jgi:hypothetical protein
VAWEAESIKKLSLKCKEISHATINRLLAKKAGKLNASIYRIEIL